MLSGWVIERRQPDRDASRQATRGLLGLRDQSSTLANAYLLVNTASAPGAGIVSDTISSTAPRIVTSLSGVHGRHAVQRCDDGDGKSGGDHRIGRHARRPGGRVHVRPRAVHRLHATGESRVVGQERDGITPDPVRRSVLRRRRRRRPAGLGRSEQGGDPAGRRAAAAARESRAVPQSRAQAVAALLVSATRRKGRARDDRRRSRQRRHRRTVQSVPGAERARMQRRGLAMHSQHVLHLQRHAGHGRRDVARLRQHRASKSLCT